MIFRAITFFLEVLIWWETMLMGKLRNLIKFIPDLSEAAN